jgi:DNA-binding NarL/FixJ family response regulator
MATAKQIADKTMKGVLDGIDEELERINQHLAKYDALIQARDRLTAARRALLATRAPTANGGGKGLSQEEVVAAVRELRGGTVYEVAQKLSANESAVRAHLNRGKDERFELKLVDGKKIWTLREPEEDEDESEE